jgi:hypothetical protein
LIVSFTLSFANARRAACRVSNCSSSFRGDLGKSSSRCASSCSNDSVVSSVSGASARGPGRQAVHRSGPSTANRPTHARLLVRISATAMPHVPSKKMRLVEDETDACA